MSYSCLVKRFGLIIGLIVIGLMMTNVVFAGTTGKISGVVVDQNTGEPLPGVNVVVEGTTMGAATDADGRYNIINVRPGTYTVVASIIGYQTTEIENLTVTADLTTTADFQLSEQVLEGEVITIRAERPLVQRDQTSTVRVTTSEEIENLPVRNVQEVVGLSAGVVQYQDSGGSMTRRRGGQATTASNIPQLNVRGGRANQVAYIVDGFSVRDPISGNTTATIAPDAVDQIVVMTGGFNAEYGRIMSGAINVTTKRGTQKFSGNLHAVTDNIGVGSDPQDYNIYDFSLSGPLIPGNDKVNFFVSGSRAWERNRTPKYNISGDYFDGVAEMDSVELADAGYVPTINTFDSYSTDFENYRDGVLPANWRDGWSWQGKIGIDLTQNLKVDIGTLGSVDKYQRYQHRYLFNAKHTAYFEDENMAFNAKVTYQLNKNTVMNLAGNYFSVSRFTGDGYYKDDYMAYGRPNGNPNYDETFLFFAWDDMDGVTETEMTNYGWDTDVWGAEAADWDSVAFVTSGNEAHVNRGAFGKRSSSYYGFDFNVISQVHPDHEVKFGFDMQRHKLRFYQAIYANRAWAFLDNPGYAAQDNETYGYYFDPVKNELVESDDPTKGDHAWQYGEPYEDLNGNGSYDQGEPFEDVGNGYDGPKEPTTFAFYLQDKYEYEGIVLNFGLRYDYLDPNTDRLKNEEYPLGDPDDPNTVNPNRLDPEDLEASEAQTAFSPRIGIGFPVTETTVFHASYGVFYQQPDLSDLYAGMTYFEYYVRNSPYFTFVGNPNLDWEKTTAYEFGLRHQLSERSVLEITSYYKSISDLAQLQNQASFPASFTTYRNTDYGTVKGFDFSFRTLRTNNLAMSLDYSLSWATGTGSTSTSTYNSQWHGEEQPKTTAPLDYDQRHKFTFNMDYRYGNNAPISLLNNFGVNILGNLASGTPYTPAEVYNEVTEQAVTPVTNGAINSRYGPWTFRLDLKANRSFSISGLDMNFYVWVLNLLDRQNPVDVYEGTGDSESTSWLNTAEGQAFVDQYADPHDTSALSGEEKYLLKERNPRSYDIPRVVRLGVEIGF